MTRRCLHAQAVADLNMVVEVVRRQAGFELGMVGGGRDTFDRHSVVRRIGSVRQGVAAGDRPRACRLMRIARRNIQRKGQELARLERSQRLAVDGLQVERALRVRGVLERTLSDAELAPAVPSARGWKGGPRTGGRYASPPPERDRDGDAELKHERRRDVGKQQRRAHDAIPISTCCSLARPEQRPAHTVGVRSDPPVAADFAWVTRLPGYPWPSALSRIVMGAVLSWTAVCTLCGPSS